MKATLILLFSFFVLSCQTGLDHQPFTASANWSQESDFPAIGIQIQNARIKKSVSISKLADATGLSEQNIKHIESNKAMPTRETLVEIQKILDCDIVLDAI